MFSLLLLIVEVIVKVGLKSFEVIGVPEQYILSTHLILLVSPRLVVILTPNLK